MLASIKVILSFIYIIISNFVDKNIIIFYIIIFNLYIDKKVP